MWSLQLRQMPNVIWVTTFKYQLLSMRHKNIHHTHLLQICFILLVTKWFVLRITQSEFAFHNIIAETFKCFWAESVGFFGHVTVTDSHTHSTHTSCLTLVSASWWHLVVVFWQDELLEGRSFHTGWVTAAFSCFTVQRCVNKVTVGIFMALTTNC